MQLGIISRNGVLVGVVARAACGEHAARDQAFSLNIFQKAEDIERVVEAEGRIYDGQERLDFASGRHARHHVGALNGPDQVNELDGLATLASAVEVSGAAIERRIELVCA